MLDSSDFATSYLDGYPRTLKFLRSRGAAPGDIEDLAQAAWTAAWEHRDSYQGRSTFLTYVLSIAFNEFMNLCNRGRRGRDVDLSRKLAVRADDVRADISVSWLLRRSMTLDALGSVDAALLRRYYLEDLGDAMTATERTRLKRARERVRITSGPPGPPSLPAGIKKFQQERM